MASNIEVLKPGAEYKALRKTVDLAARSSRQAILAAGVAVRLFICPGDDIAVATLTSSSIVAGQENKEAVLPAPSREGEIIWQQEKEA